MEYIITLLLVALSAVYAQQHHCSTCTLQNRYQCCGTQKECCSSGVSTPTPQVDNEFFTCAIQSLCVNNTQCREGLQCHAMKRKLCVPKPIHPGVTGPVRRPPTTRRGLHTTPRDSDDPSEEPVPEPRTDEPEPGTDEPEPGTDEPEPGTDEPEPEPEPETDEPEPGDELGDDEPTEEPTEEGTPDDETETPPEKKKRRKRQQDRNLRVRKCDSICDCDVNQCCVEVEIGCCS